jgi:hypothetical protein
VGSRYRAAGTLNDSLKLPSWVQSLGGAWNLDVGRRHELV